MIKNHLVEYCRKLRRNPLYVLSSILKRFAYLVPNDEIYLRWYYFLTMGKRLNLENPQTYNEKIQWLKLYDHNSLYTRMVDKYEAKGYVADIIGKKHIIPTLAVYDRAEDIDFDSLPNQFVLKCTHDSGGVVVCRDKKKFDRRVALMKLKKGLSQKFYSQTREWPYLNVKPRIIVEQYVSNNNGECDSEEDLKDYKFFCFDGNPQFMFVASDRMKVEDTKFDFFDMDYKFLPMTNGHPNSKVIPEKPQGFEKMKELAVRLSKGLPHVRVDFYDVAGHVYFGELTFYHWSGFVPFEPEKWDMILGNCLKIPAK